MLTENCARWMLQTPSERKELMIAVVSGCSSDYADIWSVRAHWLMYVALPRVHRQLDERPTRATIHSTPMHIKSATRARQAPASLTLLPSQDIALIIFAPTEFGTPEMTPQASLKLRLSTEARQCTQGMPSQRGGPPCVQEHPPRYGTSSQGVCQSQSLQWWAR